MASSSAGRALLCLAATAALLQGHAAASDEDMRGLWLQDEDIKLDKRIGRGGSAVVFSGHFRDSPVALKEVRSRGGGGRWWWSRGERGLNWYLSPKLVAALSLFFKVFCGMFCYAGP